MKVLLAGGLFGALLGLVLVMMRAANSRGTSSAEPPDLFLLALACPQPLL